MKIRALDLRPGDQVTLTLTVSDVQTYRYRKDQIVSFGDAGYNLTVNVDGNTRLPRYVPWWWRFLLRLLQDMGSTQ